MERTRREFLELTVVFVGTAAGSCGHPDTGGDENACAEGVDFDIEDNHTPAHRLIVSAADVEAGESKTYSLQGGSDHDHTVTINEPNFEALFAGEEIQTVSSEGGGGGVGSHYHIVFVRC